jgi:hypothetical protein
VRSTSFYLSDELILRLDRWCRDHHRRTGFSPSRSQAVAMLLGRALTREGVAEESKDDDDAVRSSA